MTTITELEHQPRPAAGRAMQPAYGRGWHSGFANLFSKELGDWFGPRRWWVQTVAWLAVLNGLLAFVLFVLPQFDATLPQPGQHGAGNAAEVFTSGLSLFFKVVALAGAVGIILLSQDEIVQEKQAGTAAWILSKPVGRPSFILSKLLANTLGSFVFIIALPGLAAYLEIQAASGHSAPVGQYVLGLCVPLLEFVFYITLTLMLGAIFEERRPVLAGSLGLVVVGFILIQFVPQIGYVLPLTMDQVATTIILGRPLASALAFELITAALFSVIFTVAALWKFGDAEL